MEKEEKIKAIYNCINDTAESYNIGTGYHKHILFSEDDAINKSYYPLGKITSISLASSYEDFSDTTGSDVKVEFITPAGKLISTTIDSLAPGILDCLYEYAINNSINISFEDKEEHSVLSWMQQWRDVYNGVKNEPSEASYKNIEDVIADNEYSLIITDKDGTKGKLYSSGIKSNGLLDIALQ